MYRVFILILLAIGFSAFAVDSSQSILQAKKISDISMTLTWSAIPDATKYKIFYDESALLDPVSPNPLLDTDFIEKTEGDIQKLSPATDYTLIVYAYNKDGQDIGKTIPLHAKTYSALPQMNLTQDPLTSSENTIELGFSRPIDISQVQIALKNPKTKKLIPILDVKTSLEDLRIIIITLKSSMELTVPYELTLQKVISLDGTELPPENKIPLKIVYNGVLPPLASLGSEENVPPPSSIIDEPLERDVVFSEPVPIDNLPQTGPGILLIALLSASVVFFIQKKLSKRA